MNATGRGKCRSCRAAIVWALTGTGNKMPVDAEPHAEGSLVLELGDDGMKVRPANAEERTMALPLMAALRRDTKLYRSHFATCPDAKEHRRDKRQDARMRKDWP